MVIYSGGIVSSDGITLQQNEEGSLEVADSLVINVIENTLSITEIEAETGVTPFDHSTSVSDTYSDTTGYKNSVNTGDTTADFDTDEYVARSTQGSQETFVGGGGGSTNTDFNYDVTIVNGGFFDAISMGGSTGNSAQVIITEGSGTGGTEILNVTKNAGSFGLLTYTASEYNRLFADAEGKVNIRIIASNGERDGNSPDFNGTNFTYDASVDGNCPTDAGSVTLRYTPLSIPTDKSVIDHTLPTITGNVQYVQLVCNITAQESEDAVTFDISDGSTTLTDQAVNEKIEWTGSSNPDSLIINLDPQDTNPVIGSPAVKTYVLKLWKE